MSTSFSGSCSIVFVSTDLVNEPCASLTTIALYSDDLLFMGGDSPGFQLNYYLLGKDFFEKIKFYTGIGGVAECQIRPDRFIQNRFFVTECIKTKLAVIVANTT